MQAEEPFHRILDPPKRLDVPLFEVGGSTDEVTCVSSRVSREVLIEDEPPPSWSELLCEDNCACT